MANGVIGNPMAEDLRRCCDALYARIGELESSLRWTAAGLQAAAKHRVQIRESDLLVRDEVRRTVSEVLDEADRLLASKAGEKAP